ncbi:Glyoxylase, beta-lactamase superfamily II [Chitinophaga sp. YR627]|nr:Glyoxylase, beta-lactamase superfamily II [Chitinophaga sp. YR627]
MTVIKQTPLLPGTLQWTIGNRKVTVLSDSHFNAGEEFFTKLPEEGVRSSLIEAFRPESLILTTSVFLIESEEHEPVLIDTGMGTKMAPHLTGRLTEALAFIGKKPEDIGIILITHLHGDHFYGLLDPEKKRAFPNAKVWLSQTEYDYWFNNPQLSEQEKTNTEDAREALAPYEMLVDDGKEIVPGITSVPLPGHTMGQTGFLLTTSEEKLLFCADILNLPAIQLIYPEVGFATDADHDLAVKTRRDTLSKAAEERLLLAGPHFEFPCLTYVKVQGSGFQFVPKQYI